MYVYACKHGQKFSSGHSAKFKRLKFLCSNDNSIIQFLLCVHIVTYNWWAMGSIPICSIKQIAKNNYANVLMYVQHQVTKFW